MLGGGGIDSMLEVRIVARSLDPFVCLSGIPVQPQASIDDIERADAIVQSMMQHTQRQRGSHKPTDLNALVTEYVRLAVHSHQAEPTKLDFRLRADAIVVCDMYTPVNESPLGKYPEEIRWLKQMHARGALLSSVCSGATLLAESGLLNGYEVSSHWAYQDMFRRYFPQVKMLPNAILNLSAEKERVVSSADLSDRTLLRPESGAQHRPGAPARTTRRRTDTVFVDDLPYASR